MIRNWKMAQGYVTGKMHQKKNIPCQDRTFHLKNNGVDVVVLADGAGSSKHSDIGATIATRETATFLTNQFHRLISLENEEISRMILGHILVRLSEQASKEGNPLKDYASTLLFVAVSGTNYISGHLGDGVIAYHKDGCYCVFSLPEQGEYINSTFFTTSYEAEYRFRIHTDSADGIHGFILMSDGSAESLFNRNEVSLAEAIPIFHDWLQKNPGSKVSHALNVNLENVIKTRTTDDCSLALMARVETPYEIAVNFLPEQLADFEGACSTYSQRIQDEGEPTLIKKPHILKVISSHIRRFFSKFRVGPTISSRR